MGLGSTPGIALALLAWACASHAGVDATAAPVEAPSAEIVSEPQSAPRVVDLSRERQLVEEGRAAVKAVDFSPARTKAGEAIELLLARPERERDSAWLELLDAAGGVARDAQDAPTARVAWEKVLEVRSRTLPDDHPDLQAARLNLAITEALLGDVQGARAIFEKVVEVLSRTLPDDDPTLQKARLNLATASNETGDLQSARALFEKVLEVRTRTLPDDDPRLQNVRLGLGNTLFDLGDLAAARALYEKVLEVRSRTLPDDHPDLQRVRVNLAGTLNALGDLQGAHALVQKALEGFARTLPDDHPDVQRARQGLAITKRELGNLKGARELQEKVLEVLSRHPTADPEGLLNAKLNLANTLADLGDLAGARALLGSILENPPRSIPDDSGVLECARENLAWILAREEAASARELGGNGRKDGPETERRRQRCSELIAAACRAQTSVARTAVLTSSTRGAAARCWRIYRDVGTFLSFARGLGVFEPSPELDRPCFVLSETTRGAALQCATLMRLAAGSPRYPKLRDELRRRSEELAALTRQGTTSEGFDRALARREETERELVGLANELAGGASAVLDFDVDALAGRLAEGQAVVAYRRCPRWSIDDHRGVESWVESLCAFVIRSGSDSLTKSDTGALLKYVDLGPYDRIERAVHAWRSALGVVAGARGVTPGASPYPSGTIEERGRELRQLVFDPLRGALEGVHHVVLAPDAALHVVPLDALPEDEPDSAGGKSLLGTRLRIETHVTLTELMTPSRASAAKSELVVVGGVAYDGPDPGNRADEQAGILRGGAWSTGFSDLPGTLEEARAIVRAFEDEEPDGSAIRLEGPEATREKLIELAPSARWLHVATHGWFASESMKSWQDPEPLDKQSGLIVRQAGEEKMKEMSPMLLCGLALAGANLPADGLGRVPGLITAEEIAAIDLSQCELAVLSACDTSVGERRAGQGVASLQMALQMAGARSVITSLWKVPDEATRELMTDFYRRIWIEKKPKGVALWEAKRKLRDAVDERGQSLYTTRDWAAWVLTGDPD